MDPNARSLDIARTMLKGAVWAFRQEVLKGASEERVREARQNLVFWRERFEDLWKQRARTIRAS